MRLRTKVILVCSLATASISAAAGSVAIAATAAAEMQQIDNGLNLTANNSCASSDPIGSALLALDSVGAETEIGFFSINEDYSMLSDTSAVMIQPPTKRQLKKASKTPLTINQTGGESFRLRTCAMPDQEFVVFAASLADSNRAMRANIVLWASVMGTAILLGATAIWLLTRKDLARIEMLIAKAREISNGDFDVQLETSQGNSELDTLSNSLAQMVDTLKAALNTEMQAKQRSKEFLADASHELKTPLTLIRGYSELLSGEKPIDDEMAERSRTRMQDQIMRMQSLIADMLLLAELEQTDVQDKSTVNFSQIVSDAIQDLKTLHPQRRIEADIEPQVMVVGSPRLLEQLMANIVSNLSRYVTDRDHTKIQLTRLSGTAIVQIDDSGQGLPDAAYAQGVQYFGRFDASRSRTSGGSGLGISIMNAIVAQHAGTFEMQRSDLGGLRTRISIAATD